MGRRETSHKVSYAKLSTAVKADGTMPESLHPKDAETIEFPPIEKPLACALIALLRRTKNQQVRIEEDEWVSAWLEMPAIRVKRDLTTGDMVVSL